MPERQSFLAEYTILAASLGQIVLPGSRLTSKPKIAFSIAAEASLTSLTLHNIHRI